MHRPLALHEEFMLLALSEDDGTVVASESIEVPLASAILAELLLRRRIELDPGKPGKRIVRAIDTAPVDDPILDDALRKIAESKRDRPLTSWVETVSGSKDLKHRVAGRLADRGILRADEGKVLLLFTRKTYPEIDPEPEQRIIRRFRDAIFSDSEDVDPRDGVLIALARQTGLLQKKFAAEELASRNDRLAAIADGALTAHAAKEVTEAMDTALFIAVMVPILFD